MEIPVAASTLFSIANPIALAGWIILAFGIIRNKPFWRDTVAGTWWPLALSALYTLLIIFFFFKAPGGFGTLEGVQLLFTAPWVALAGWTHYLAFDLFVGAYIARRVMTEGMSRWWLVLILPATFLFGPIGFLAHQILRLLLGANSNQTEAA
jgi:Domain of unknown function (DUF4281)